MALPLLYQNLICDQFDHIVNTIDEREKKAKIVIRNAIDTNGKEKAREEKQLCKSISTLLEYFQSYWIDTITPAMFCVQNLQHRTNNSAEGVYSFLKCLRRLLLC